MNRLCALFFFLFFTGFGWAETNYGLHADGKTDDTVILQRALDAMGKTGGGVVALAAGNYFFAGHLVLPRAVTLAGVWKSVPSHVGLRSRGAAGPMDDGTTFLVTENEGREDGPPFISLQDDSTLTGIVIYYPKQIAGSEPRMYPWAIAMRGKNPAVREVELLNPYNGIDATQNERHLIQNVSGQPLRRGIWVDAIYDVGRIENVHFNPWWSMQPKLIEWQRSHGEAFIFGRSDWQYVLNTFCFGYKSGYKFVASGAGVCNGNFLGIGADDCFTDVEVEDSANYGLLIANGEFTAFHGPDPTMVRVGQRNTGSVRFSNCAFWGPCQQIAKIDGTGTVGFSDCTFAYWDAEKKGHCAIQADGGNLLVRGCEFQIDRPQVKLGSGVKKAVISDNLIKGKLRIEAKGQFQIHDNAADN